ncbi:DNA cytosine methyltransferase [Nocardioides sp. B-3]|uniref:DNA cytosine methyltransferase n=1 Tax=Nocardioides sp. B-3 TaxID=2895565 RepID=UPI0021522547|nr:DNA cytosine methyltransferase [Nocardioides sp. B-3]
MLLGMARMCDRPLVVDDDALTDPVWRPIAIDLFAGVGGLSLGFEQAGFDIVAAVEYDPVHAATHAYNFPGTEVLCRDVGALTAKRVLAAAQRGFERMYPERVWPGKVDAVIGGPPCQGFSTGGKREDGDERNLLLLEFARLIKGIKPKVVCLENVAGLPESRFDDVRVELFKALEEAGYSLSGSRRRAQLR